MVTLNRQKSLIFTVLPKQRKQLKAFSTIYGRKNYKDCGNSDSNNNTDKDNDNISEVTKITIAI